jgi:predicted nucleic acid-binding protein
MKKYLIDASVFLTAVLEPKSSVTSKLRQLFSDPKVEIHSIYLVRLEFANGLRFSLKDADLASSAFEKFYSLPIKIFDMKSNHLLGTLNQAYVTKTTVYDASYHYAAKILNATFITVDKKYYTAASDLGDIVLW